MTRLSTSAWQGSGAHQQTRQTSSRRARSARSRIARLAALFSSCSCSLSQRRVQARVVMQPSLALAPLFVLLAADGAAHSLPVSRHSYHVAPPVRHAPARVLLLSAPAAVPPLPPPQPPAPPPALFDAFPPSPP